MAPNVWRSLFPIRHFVHTYMYMHNLKTKGHIRKDILPIERMLDYQRYLFSGLELYVRYEWRVMDPTLITITFRYDILCVLTLITRKLLDIYGHCTYRTTALLSEMSIFSVWAGCEIYRTNALLSATFLEWFRVAGEIHVLLEIYSPRHDMHQWSLIQHCVRKLQTHTYIAIWCTTTTYMYDKKLTYLMTAYYTPKDGFTANHALFYKNKVG